MSDIITREISPYHAWQGPADKAPEIPSAMRYVPTVTKGNASDSPEPCNDGPQLAALSVAFDHTSDLLAHWMERAEKAERENARLQQQLSEEKSLADRLYGALDCAPFDYIRGSVPYFIGVSATKSAYRKARGL